MAQVRSLKRRVPGAARVHGTLVDCEWWPVEAAHGTLLQLTTYGSDDRKKKGGVSQTLQLSRTQALQLKEVIEDVFP